MTAKKRWECGRWKRWQDRRRLSQDGQISDSAAIAAIMPHRMLNLAHLLIVSVYITLPAFMLVRAGMIAIRRGRRGELQRFWVTASGGMVMGVVACSFFAITLHGRLMPTQVLLAAYFATGLLLILKGLDRGLWYFWRWACGCRRGRGQDGRFMFGPQWRCCFGQECCLELGCHIFWRRF